MKKAFDTKKELNNFKQQYLKVGMKSEVIFNIIVNGNNSSSKVENFKNKCYFNKGWINIIMIDGQFAQKALEEKFGRYEFKCSGNRMYYNWVLTQNELIFIVPSKREVIIPDNIPVDFIDLVLDFEISFIEFVLDYVKNHLDELDTFTKKCFNDLLKSKFYKNGKIVY